MDAKPELLTAAKLPVDAKLVVPASFAFDFSIRLDTKTETWEYAPLPDITAYEVSLFLKLFICVTFPRSTFGAYAEADEIIKFVKDNNLQRHFAITSRS